MRRRVGWHATEGAGDIQRDFFRLQLFADFGADPNQVGTRGLRVAFAKSQLHAHVGDVGYRDALARRVQPDQVAHHDFSAKLARPPAAGVMQTVLGAAQAHQGRTHPGQRLARLVQRYAQVLQQHVQRRLAVQPGHHIALAGRDVVIRRDGLAALRDA